MNLFKRFTETIFLKTDSDLQKKGNVLKGNIYERD